MEKRSVNSIGMFDAAKGLFVLLMIFGHSMERVTRYWDTDMERTVFALVQYYFGRVCSYCAISMFFMICGYGFRKRSMAKAVEGQVKFLWKPYILASLSIAVIAVAKKIVIHGDIIEGLKYQALPYLLGIGTIGNYFGIDMYCIGPMWFLVTFVFAGILLNAVLHEKRTWAQWILVGMLAAVGVTLRNYFIPFCFQQSLVCSLYMYIGWTLKKQKFLEAEIPGYFTVVTVLFLMFAALFGKVVEAANVWDNGLTDVFASVLGGVIAVKLSLELNRFQGKFMQFVRWLGRQALMFCSIHTVFYVAIPWEKVIAYLGGNAKLVAVIAATVYSVTGIGGCWLVEKVKQIKRRNEA